MMKNKIEIKNKAVIRNLVIFFIIAVFVTGFISCTDKNIQTPAGYAGTILPGTPKIPFMQPGGSPAQAGEYWPPSCENNCPDGITLVCISNIYDECGARTSACAKGCTIYAPNEMCALFGFPPDSQQQMSHNVFREKTQCKPVVKNPDNLYDCCAFRHEYAHTCDERYKDPTKPTNGCGETIAQNYQDTCMKNTFDYFCGNPQKWSDSACKTSCAKIEWFLLSKISDACMCNKIINNMTDSYAVCCDCNDECKNANRLLSLMPQKCIAKGWINNYNQSSVCSGIFTGPHGCSFYGITDSREFDTKMCGTGKQMICTKFWAIGDDWDSKCSPNDKNYCLKCEDSKFFQGNCKGEQLSNGSLVYQCNFQDSVGVCEKTCGAECCRDEDCPGPSELRPCPPWEWSSKCNQDTCTCEGEWINNPDAECLKSNITINL